MQRFYRALSNGTPRGEALRAAKIEMMQKGAPVEDWAAFVLSGDGLSPLTPYWSWSELLAGAAVLLAAAGLALSSKLVRKG
jgi:hypothetical protein